MLQSVAHHFSPQSHCMSPTLFQSRQHTAKDGLAPCTGCSHADAITPWPIRQRIHNGQPQNCIGLCRASSLQASRAMIPVVADHPVHLPRLQLRPGPQPDPKGPGMGVGMGQRVASGPSLTEPGSGVSTDTPGAMPWGQQSTTAHRGRCDPSR